MNRLALGLLPVRFVRSAVRILGSVLAAMPALAQYGPKDVHQPEPGVAAARRRCGR